MTILDSILRVSWTSNAVRVHGSGHSPVTIGEYGGSFPFRVVYYYSQEHYTPDVT